MSLDTFIDTLTLVTGMRANQDFYTTRAGSITVIGRGKVVDIALVRGQYQVSLLDGGKFIIVARESAQKAAAWAVRALIMR